MRKMFFILLSFIVPSCALLVPVESFFIKFVEVRECKDNKLREESTNARYDNSDGKYKEIIFSTNLNLAKLVLNGYVGGGYYSHDKKIDSCIIYDETLAVEGKHISLRDWSLKSRESIANYLRKIENKNKYIYSCVIDASSIKNTKISFHIELSYFATYAKYISNTIEVDFLTKER